MGTEVTVYTVGHSNHTIEHFVGLLRPAGIRRLVDVRSNPVSGYCPHFDKEPLQRALRVAGIQYVFLGAELGGRPPETEFYDAAGYVLYGEIARSPRFQAGIQKLLEGAAQCPTAIMCGEEDPAACHRHLLISRVLAESGHNVMHIRGDGTLESYDDVLNRDRSPQLNLFDHMEPAPWKSTRSVLPRSRPETSSEP
jgi:uncharacterized protein (DUF488 family)